MRASAIRAPATSRVDATTRERAMAASTRARGRNLPSHTGFLYESRTTTGDGRLDDRSSCRCHRNQYPRAAADSPVMAADRRLADIASATPGDAGYRLLFDRHPQPMWVYDVANLRFLAVNDSAVRHYGYTREEFLEMTLADLRPADDRERLAARMAELADGGSDGVVAQWRHLLKDGTPIDV